MAQKMPQKKNVLPLLGGLGVALTLMYTLGNCARGSSAAADGNSGGDTIDVAIEYSPLSFYQYDDTLGGYNYDLLRLLARDHNLVFNYHPVTAVSKPLEKLENGDYDLLVADIPATTELKEQYTLLEPVLLDKQVLVQRKDPKGNVKIKSQLDLAGDTLWIVAGSSIEKRINNLAKEIGSDINIKHEDEYGAEQLFIMTALGEINNAVVNERVARELIDKYPNVDISTDISFTQFQSWLTSKANPALADSINKWLVDLKKTDEYQMLVEKYLSK
ncbi:MAG: transporter substrate-binding domain-containing protein [Bacteroides sp.]|nr:transporter substrate-binding domain-containing protein [Bacteroides sp.]